MAQRQEDTAARKASISIAENEDSCKYFSAVVSFYLRVSLYTLDNLQADQLAVEQKVEAEDVSVSAFTQKLAQEVFGRRKIKKNLAVAQYLAELGDADPQFEDCRAFVRQSVPQVSDSFIGYAWRKVQDYFVGLGDAEYEALQNLGDVGRLATFFRRAAEKEEATQEGALSDVHEATSALHQPLPSASVVSSNASGNQHSGGSGCASGSSASGSSGSRSNGSTGSSPSSLSPTAIAKMRAMFDTNWNSYAGESWTLKSGLCFDDRLRDLILGLDYEASLHSFIVQDISEVMGLSADPSDKEELSLLMSQVHDDDAWKLKPSETEFLSHYNKSPGALKELLKKGYGGVMEEAAKDGENLPEETFCDAVHHIVDRYHRIYQRNLWRMPSGKSESWYRESLWWILADLFNEPEVTVYEPGEHHSKASGERKNGKRKASTVQQQVGRRVDGIILSCTPVLELGVMEAAKADNGAYSTKALSDTIKMAKVMKDQFDRVQQTSTVDVRGQLRTFGLRIAAGSVCFYDLRHIRGRWYQLACHGTASFPEVWKENGANTNVLLSALLSAISSLFALKRQVGDMAINVEQWSEPVFGQLKPVEPHNKVIPATLTTPRSSPAF
ncbi:hypothetical protein BGZ73_002010 [Actinomortierella ambigua]|nr:hypothetical protein BGZ73_002010 [Actinomortierella ambigua]